MGGIVDFQYSSYPIRGEEEEEEEGGSSVRSVNKCRSAEWVAFLHAIVIATVVMCRVRNPAYTARERPRVGALYKW